MTKLPFESGVILVTGASGFLGEHLVRLLVADGCEVAGTSFTRSTAIAGARIVPVDLRDRAAAERLVRDVRPAAIFHCAAITDAGLCEREPESARAGILDSTANLVAAVEAFHPGIPFVAVSTDLVFDGENAPYSESAEAKPLSLYGSLKYRAESPVLGLARGIVLRAALMFGPPTTHKGGFLSWMINAVATGQPLPLFEDEVRTPVDGRDVARAMVALATTAEAHGVFHAGGPERLSRMEMGRILCRVLGTGENLLVPTRLADSNYPAPRPRDVSLDSGRLRKAVGFGPRTLEAGLRELTEQTPPRD